ncbi:hypothetical protein B0T16DRAFT_509284 [Cercophora newfieldiana]|uniref:Uncharacterized protein n=1 Tax=Cercophora newfieldiana TaxID=92897 RepID=A0AA39Y3U9_9PEZI|nr:hypothetical protein B0T16DRAFT_509284 [Cercophora newfieldiana]
MTPNMNGQRASSPRIIILTNSELGQANVAFALTLGLLEQDPNLDIHISSFAQLQTPLDTFTALAKESIPSARPSVIATDQPDPAKNFITTSSLPPGPFTTPQFIRMYLHHLMLCWPAPELSPIITTLLTTISTLQPHTIIIDSLFSPGFIAALHARSTSTLSLPSLIMLTPNTIKDHITHHLSLSEHLFRFPVNGAALPAPLPRASIPLNIFYFLCLTSPSPKPASTTPDATPCKT